MTDEEQIKELYIRYWQYMIDKDADGLNSLQTDDYYLMHMTGVKQSREVFIKGLLDGTFNYYSAEHDSIDVNITGDTAVMVGKSRVVAAVYGGGKAEVAKLDKDERYYHRTDEQLVQFAGWKPEFEKA